MPEQFAPAATALAQPLRLVVALALPAAAADGSAGIAAQEAREGRAAHEAQQIQEAPQKTQEAPRKAQEEPAEPPTGGITSVRGVRAGHHTYPGGRTGCTVVVVPGGAVAGVDVRGGAPGTVETDLLDPVATVQKVNAVALAGGSAFGLAARQGVVRWLEERGEGHAIGPDTVVPIVPGAIIFDLRVAGGTRPGAECGYLAAEAAATETGPLAEGNAGAGAGATVGKLLGAERAMKGGAGTAALVLADGLVVAALVVVNAVGDVIDPATSKVLAGARGPDGQPADARKILRGGAAAVPAGRNTTIGVVATNAQLTQAEATKVAQMAHDGLARVIWPSHMPGDGDTIFALATGELGPAPGVGRIGALAADVVAEAVLRAVRAATGIPGVPSAADLAAK